jgi:hypothetical protein
MVSHNRPILTITMVLALVAVGAPVASAQRELTPRAATTINPASAVALRSADRDSSDQRSTAIGALGTPTAAEVAAATLVNREIGSTNNTVGEKLSVREGFSTVSQIVQNRWRDQRCHRARLMTAGGPTRSARHPVPAAARSGRRFRILAERRIATGDQNQQETNRRTSGSSPTGQSHHDCRFPTLAAVSATTST